MKDAVGIDEIDLFLRGKIVPDAELDASTAEALSRDLQALLRGVHADKPLRRERLPEQRKRGADPAAEIENRARRDPPAIEEFRGDLHAAFGEVVGRLSAERQPF